MKRLQIHLILAFMLFLNGCSFLGIDFTENRTIAIQKSPYVVIMDGDLTTGDLKSVDRVLSILSTQPYSVSDNTNFQVHVTDQTTVTKANEIKNDSETIVHEEVK